MFIWVKSTISMYCWFLKKFYCLWRTIPLWQIIIISWYFAICLLSIQCQYWFSYDVLKLMLSVPFQCWISLSWNWFINCRWYPKLLRCPSTFHALISFHGRLWPICCSFISPMYSLVALGLISHPLFLDDQSLFPHSK